MSRHHILPPIVYTPEPPKPKQTERRRGVGSLKGKGATDDVDETEEAGEVFGSAPARTAPALPPHSTAVEATERRMPSTTGKLSGDTLKAMLEAQEQDGAQVVGGGIAPKG